MKLPRLFRRSISARLFLLSLVPLILSTVLLTWHTTRSQRAEMEHSIRVFSHHTANYLSEISQFPLYAGNTRQLRILAETITAGGDFGGILFLDADRQPLVNVGLPSAVEKVILRGDRYPEKHPDFLFVQRPIFLTSPDVTDFADRAGEENRKLLGWVLLAVDKAGPEQRIQLILLTNLVISFLIFLGAAVLTYYLSGTLVSPIKSLTRTVRQLERGDLDARAQVPQTQDELAALANGVNHLAQAVSESRENLQGKIDRATQRLQGTLEDLQAKNEELEVARREAEAGNQAKGDFLAQMSHELRTPVTAVQGFVNLLGNSDNLSAIERRYCLIIQQASLQLLQLIDDILETTRFQSQGITIESAPFDLAECVETPLSLMAPGAHDKGLELILDIEPDVPLTLEGDILRIRQIVYNLVANAIKFTHSGRVLVTLRYRRPCQNDTGRLSIAVADTGIGIPEKDRQQIFEAFAQADTSVSRQFGGSGLGLSIVKNLVNLMDGSVDIDSLSGRGSVFTVTLPLRPSDLPANYPSASYRRVLLLDRHPESRQALEHLLTRFVDEVDSCESIAEAEFAAGDNSPELLLLSASAEENLESLRQRLARLRQIFPIPVVVVSPIREFQRGIDAASLSDFDVKEVIDKPPSLRDLASVLASDRDGVRGQSQHLPTQLEARVLVAEDNDFMRQLLATLLERYGCTCSTVSDGEDAVAACRAERFDILMLDVHMPGVSGLDAVGRIREEGANVYTPIIMITADILQQEETALFEAGADELVFKPLDEDKLLQLLSKYVRGPMRPSGANHTQVPREAFVREVKRLTEAARAALAEDDTGKLRETLHQLLGVAGVFKMTYLERAVRGLHSAVKKGDLDIMAASMETLDLEVRALEASLQSDEA